MLKSLTGVGLVAAVLAATAAPATAASAAAPENASITVVTVNGSGCPAGEGSARLSPSRASFSITSPSYIAGAGGPTGPTDFRRNCQISLQFNGVEGWTYAISRITSTGFAYLPAGATGLSQVSFYFQGDSTTTRSSLALVGPLAEPWTATESFDEDALVWAPCNAQRNLNINTELRVTAGSDPETASVLVRDSLTRGRIVWRQCPAA
jgi:hypothetical protein